MPPVGNGFYPEIEEFLSIPGRTLLIKGLPGVGKTTLALNLLEYLCAQAGPAEYPRGVYFSTRVSEEALQRQFPWVSFSRLEVEDLRLSSIESFLGDVLRKIRASSPVIVLDSWDAYAREMDERDRLKTEKTLVSIASSSKSRLIFVSEETRTTTLEYLVDGVVELSAETLDSRLFRVSYLRKLRGVNIRHHVKPYTLLGGVLRAFGVYEEPDYTFTRRPNVIGDFDGRFSLGSHTMDEKLGGIPYGNTLSVEYSPEVPQGAISALPLPAVVNFLLMGRSVVIVPIPGVSAEILARWLLNLVGEEVFEQHVAISSEISPPPSGFKEVLFNINGSMDEAVEELERAVERLRRTSVDGKVLLVTSVNRLENHHGQEAHRIAWLVDRTIAEVFKILDAQILLVEENSPLRPKVVGTSQRYVKLRARHGVVLVYGEKPYTPLHALEYVGRDPLSPRITEIV